MMATSSKMAVVSTANSDLPRRESSICSLSTFLADDDDNRHHKHQSMTMDDILRNIYSSTGTGTGNDMDDNGHHQQLHHHAEARSVDEVWKEIVAGGAGVGVGEEEVGVAEGDGGDQVRGGEGGGGGGGGMEEMTLEDFLTRAGAVREEDVSVNAGGVPIGYGQFQVQPPPPPSAAQGQLVYANGTTSASGGGGGGGGGGRAGKRRAVQEAPLDKATQQKQRRMIKNRESAARSRERKQAYTVELESLVTQLEEENARLLRQQAEQKKERFKQLMENLIPVVEKRRPPHVLRRVHSVHW